MTKWKQDKVISMYSEHQKQRKVINNNIFMRSIAVVFVALHKQVKWSVSNYFHLNFIRCKISLFSRSNSANQQWQLSPSHHILCTFYEFKTTKLQSHISIVLFNLSKLQMNKVRRWEMSCEWKKKKTCQSAARNVKRCHDYRQRCKNVNSQKSDCSFITCVSSMRNDRQNCHFVQIDNLWESTVACGRCALD